MSILCIWLQVINEVKVTHQGEGHIKVKVKYLHPFKFYVANTFCKQVVCFRLNAFLFCPKILEIWEISGIRDANDNFTPTDFQPVLSDFAC